jgi:Family of unknown function (DUF6232)
VRIYFRGFEAVVTSEHFIRRTSTTTRAFLVRDLRNVCITRAGVAARTAPYFFGGAVLALAVAAPMWQLSAPSAIVLLGLAGLGAVLALLALRGRPQPWVLEGTYHGERVVLYESTDERVFNQVSRALRRAIEDGRPPAARDGLSGAA